MILIETSCWIEALRKDGRPQIRERIRHLMQEGCAAWCEIILLELWNGARGNYEREFLEQLEKEIPLLPITSEVWRKAYGLAQKCRKAGHTIPATDLLISACARHHAVSLESTDSHFDLLRRI